VLERVSVSSTGAEADGSSDMPRMSESGRYVAFRSDATNLVPNDTNGQSDIFVRDRVAQTTGLVSIGSAGQQSTAAVVRDHRISNDGRYVLFFSDGLDPADTDPSDDIYLRDRVAGTTIWISDTDNGESHGSIDLSGDGRVVAFSVQDSNGESLVVKKLATGQVLNLQAVPWSPTQDGHSYGSGVLSRDGTKLFFHHVRYHANGDIEFDIGRLDLATNASSVVTPIASSETPVRASSSGRYLLYTEFGFGAQSGNSRLYRLDTETLEARRIDDRLLPPPMFGFQGTGVADYAISGNGQVAAFSSDDDTMLAGDQNPWHNAFVRVVNQHGSLRADFDPSGQDTDGPSVGVALSFTGHLIAFDSWASVLVPNDTNNVSDVFVRGVCGPHYPDLDGDGYGDSNASAAQFCLPAPAGWSVDRRDCNDGDALIHPGVLDGCDGIDQDCDGSIDEDTGSYAYCTPSISSQLCSPTVVAQGCPSASTTSGVLLTAHNVDAQRSAAFFYGPNSMAAPWGSTGLNWMCVAPPRQRTTVLDSGGTTGCTGSLALDLWAWIAAHPGAIGSPLTPGQSLFVQAWFRDPAAPLGTSLARPWALIVAP
jgi:Tol biopolymer transport system component